METFTPEQRQALQNAHLLVVQAGAAGSAGTDGASGGSAVRTRSSTWSSQDRGWDDG